MGDSHPCLANVDSLLTSPRTGTGHVTTQFSIEVLLEPTSMDLGLAWATKNQLQRTASSIPVWTWGWPGLTGTRYRVLLHQQRYGPGVARATGPAGER